MCLDGSRCATTAPQGHAELAGIGDSLFINTWIKTMGKAPAPYAAPSSCGEWGREAGQRPRQDASNGLMPLPQKQGRARGPAKQRWAASSSELGGGRRGSPAPGRARRSQGGRTGQDSSTFIRLRLLLGSLPVLRNFQINFRRISESLDLSLLSPVFAPHLPPISPRSFPDLLRIATTLGF